MSPPTRPNSLASFAAFGEHRDHYIDDNCKDLPAFTGKSQFIDLMSCKPFTKNIYLGPVKDEPRALRQLGGASWDCILKASIPKEGQKGLQSLSLNFSAATQKVKTMACRLSGFASKQPPAKLQQHSRRNTAEGTLDSENCCRNYKEESVSHSVYVPSTIHGIFKLDGSFDEDKECLDSAGAHSLAGTSSDVLKPAVVSDNPASDVAASPAGSLRCPNLPQVINYSFSNLENS